MMNAPTLTPAQAAAERRAIEILIGVCRASRVTQARDLDFSETLIRRERALQAELDALPPAEAPAGQAPAKRAKAVAEHHLAAA